MRKSRKLKLKKIIKKIKIKNLKIQIIKFDNTEIEEH